MNNLFNKWWFLFKNTKLWKLITFLILSFIFFIISGGYWNIWLVLAFISLIYPALLFLVMFLYAWVINPLYSIYPNSKFIKSITNFFNKFFDVWN
jgi:hypothetical protein